MSEGPTDAPQSAPMRHLRFDWDGFDKRGSTIALSLHVQYPANETVHRKIVETVHRKIVETVQSIMQTTTVGLFAKDWRNADVREETAVFIKRQVRRRVRAADRLAIEGDFTVWIELSSAAPASPEPRGAYVPDAEFQKAGHDD